MQEAGCAYGLSCTRLRSLTRLVAALEWLRQVLPDDNAPWDDDVLSRLAVERRWKTAGNRASALPGDLSSDRVFADIAADLDRILNNVRSRVVVQRSRRRGIRES